MLFSSPAVCRVTSCLVRPRGSPLQPPRPPPPNCVSYIRLTLSSMLTAERRPIASPSFPSPSPVSDNSATEPRQRASLIPLFKKEQIPLLKCKLVSALVLRFSFPITLLINNYITFKLLSLLHFYRLWLCSNRFCVYNIMLNTLNVFISLLYV